MKKGPDTRPEVLTSRSADFPSRDLIENEGQSTSDAVKDLFSDKIFPDRMIDAYNSVLESNPSNDDILIVLLNMPSLRDRAWKMLSKRQPPNETLEEIIKYIPSLAESAKALLS